jgi:hypothetical protein
LSFAASGARSSSGHQHRDLARRTKGHVRIWLHIQLINASESIALRDHRQRQLTFHQSKIHSKALSLSCAEGEVRPSVDSSPVCGQKTCRLELVRIHPKVRMAMRHVGNQNDHVAARDSKTLNLICPRRHTRKCPHGWTQTESLLNHCSGERQCRKITELGCSDTKSKIYFCDQVGPRFGVTP